MRRHALLIPKGKELLVEGVDKTSAKVCPDDSVMLCFSFPCDIHFQTMVATLRSLTTHQQTKRTIDYLSAYFGGGQISTVTFSCKQVAKMM